MKFRFDWFIVVHCSSKVKDFKTDKDYNQWWALAIAEYCQQKLKKQRRGVAPLLTRHTFKMDKCKVLRLWTGDCW
jgi:hypothetical protein